MTDFEQAMATRIGNVFAQHSELCDHRSLYPWLRGWLGDVTAGVWFVAENPSLTQIRRIHTTRSTFESQWAASAGDRMFRHALCELGLKTGDPFEPGGWRCYITDVMKSVVFVKDWQGGGHDKR